MGGRCGCYCALCLASCARHFAARPTTWSSPAPRASPGAFVAAAAAAGAPFSSFFPAPCFSFLFFWNFIFDPLFFRPISFVVWRRAAGAAFFVSLSLSIYFFLPSRHHRAPARRRRQERTPVAKKNREKLAKGHASGLARGEVGGRKEAAMGQRTKKEKEEKERKKREKKKEGARASA